MAVVQPGKTEILRGQTPEGLCWEVAEWEPGLSIRPYVHDMKGYIEKTPGPLLRRELPAPRVVVILEFGPPIRVFEDGAMDNSSRFSTGFVAGLDEGCTFTKHDGHQQGIQLNLTPLGARLFFNIPAAELTHQVIEFGDLVPEHRHLCEQLEEMEHWTARFQLVEAMLLARISRSGADEHKVRAVAWSMDAIEAGAADMGVLADHLGYSHKHLITLFREYTGLPPRTLARLHRFHRLAETLKTVTRPDWAQLALEFGYYDQSHMARDTRRFAGIAPTKLFRELKGPATFGMGSE